MNGDPVLLNGGAIAQPDGVVTLDMIKQARERADAAGRGLSRKLGSGRRRGEGLGSCSGRSRGPPILKRFASEGAERVAGNEMALDVEGVLDRGVNGKKALP